MKYLILAPSGQGEAFIGDEPLGRGGEGSVFELQSLQVPGLQPAEELVAKLYHAPTEGDRQSKVRAMVMSPPASASVAWPLALVFRADRTFAGFLMRKLPSKSYRPWSELGHAKQRRSTAQTFDLRYAYTAIRNLGVAMSAVHNAGHRVGDVNESNIFIGADASVLLVDTDSAQVRGSNGNVFPCLVGKPEYTAPELQGKSFSETERTEATDAFAYAVAAYQMLTGGAHPTDATWAGAGEPPTVGAKLRGGAYPGLNPASAQGLGHPARIPASAIPTAVRAMLLKLLAPHPAQRGNIVEAVAVLDGLLPHLKQCGRVTTHWYDDRDGFCGWCAHGDAGLPDPWALEAAKPGVPRQLALPPVQFGDNAEGPVVRRAPARPAGPAAPSYAPAYPQQTPGYAPAPSLSPPQYPQAGPLPPSTPPPPSGPQKPKGGRSILNYADGTTGPRPSMGVLIRSNPKLALRCAKDETPEVAKFWWPAYRDVAPKAGLLAGLLLGLLIAAGWGYGLPLAFDSFSSPAWTAPLFQVAALTATAGVAFSSLFLTFSGLRDRKKALKAAGNDESLLDFEAVPKTILRYLGMGVVYGPLLVAGIIGMAFSLALNVIIGVIQNPSGSTPRYR